MSAAIWWIRRDLRLSDNPALVAAAAHDDVFPVFVLDPVILRSPTVGPERTAFHFEGLRHLDADLRGRGGRLIVRHGDPVVELTALGAEVGAAAVYATADHSPYARRRDNAAEQALPVCFLDGPTIRHPAQVLKADGAPYTVFSPFRRKWRSLPLDVGAPLAAPERIRTSAGPASLRVPSEPQLATPVLIGPGERKARSRLQEFVTSGRPSITEYANWRDRMDVPATTRLSPYLRFGMLSAREAVQLGIDARDNAETAADRASADAWLDELIWREFFVSILYHYPLTAVESFRPSTMHLAWRNDAGEFGAWSAGATGYPVVDAAIRQLTAEGWIHNRARMVAASFLVKDLLVDWRWGERFFRHHLLDGDPAANIGNWQWVAGTGTDAAPYFRIFNPVLQGQKHDPAGVWVRQWVPELARVPDKYVHRPWEMDLALQRRSGCVIGNDYPHPIVDHHSARNRALVAYRAARDAVNT